jgi:signal transduction histidine kinase
MISYVETREWYRLKDRVTASAGRKTATRHISKRSLGEGYIIATGVVLGAVVGGQILDQGLAGLFWLVASGMSLIVLIGGFYWLRRLELDAEQVWLVSNCSALALGVGTTALVLVEVSTTAPLVANIGTAVLGTTLAATAVTGTLGGIAVALHQSNRKLREQNAVLHRILRHNLRNDMAVVLCHLDDIEAAGDEETAATARRASEKVRSVVRLTDSVRRADVSLSGPTPIRQRQDMTQLIESRVRKLRTKHTDLGIELDLPAEAQVRVSPQFGLVVNNLVESARSSCPDTPELLFRVKRYRDTVTIIFEDRGKSMSAADLSAVAAGSETELDHGLGVELWLVEWLVDADGGDVSFEAADDGYRVRIDLHRAGSAWLG